ncbi:MAG: molybdopterin-dependent oxidoreductase [Methanobacteriaceae archaeon]|jgi:formate dehydrogenase major subunit
MEVIHSICPSCSVGCGINLIAKENKVVGTYPYKRHPVNEGKTCKKGRDCYNLIYDEKRLKNPFVRKNSNLDDSNWEEALDTIVSEIKSRSPQEIGIIGSGNSTNEDMEILKKFADALNIKNIGFYSENIPEFEIETATLDDVQNSEFILIIGDVIKETPLIGRRIVLAADSGAEIISVDTLDNTFTGLNSNKYIKIENISGFLDNKDSEVFNKLNESSTIIFNKLDNKEDFEKIYNIAKDSKSKILPVMKQCNTRGVMKILPAMDKEGIDNLIKNVKLLYVVGDNPAEYLEESLKNLDFLITQSSLMNETALLSDVVLPASCWAERSGTFTNTTGLPQKISKIVSAPDNVLEDETIIRKIAEKMEIEL